MKTRKVTTAVVMIVLGFGTTRWAVNGAAVYPQAQRGDSEASMWWEGNGGWDRYGSFVGMYRPPMNVVYAFGWVIVAVGSASLARVLFDKAEK